ncbi:hypothetical protein Bpfe_010993 [Biomphalaria pfeifferi]|uniref:Uncharacterized protein n=1 Tax=Biomphalaria pfeifferi TaxID=112525 RepID=A0AAD8BRG0_BIOPF|nr:hypothetical protein Bpfe_010993 [Biomphalaria pfeifferi]
MAGHRFLSPCATGERGLNPLPHPDTGSPIESSKPQPRMSYLTVCGNFGRQKTIAAALSVGFVAKSGH